MQYKSKISKRLTSLLMSVVMTLASVTFMVQNQELIIAQAAGDYMSNNNMVTSSEDYVALDGMNYSDVQAEPNYQMMRFSLIKVGESAAKADGYCYTGGVIKNNPISVWNTEVGDEYESTHPFETDKIMQITNPDREDSSRIGYRMNTRRDYTSQDPGTILYTSLGDVTVYDEYYNAEDPSTWGAASHTEKAGYYETSYVEILKDPSLPLVVAGASSGAKSKYQQEEFIPEGHEDWATMSAGDFFYEYTQTVFKPKDAPSFVDHAVPDFIYRMLALMCGYYEGPYKDESTFNAVEQAYQDLIASGDCKILVEPLMTFENTGEGSVIETLFGDVNYVALSCAEIGAIDDTNSGVLYGATTTNNANVKDATKNNYNFFTGNDSKTQAICNNLFTSLLMESTEWRCGLWSMFDTGAYGSDSGIDARSLFEYYVKNTTGKLYTENFMYGSDDAAHGGISTDDYGTALRGEASADNPQPYPYWESIFYTQVYEDIYGEDEPYTEHNATTVKLNGADPAAFINQGA